MDRRRAPRSRFMALARVRDPVNNASLGYIGDISSNGLMLFTHKPLDKQRHQKVAIDLPHPEGVEVTINGELGIAWLDEGNEGAPGQFRAGCRILAMHNTEKLALLQAAKAYQLTV